MEVDEKTDENKPTVDFSSIRGKYSIKKIQSVFNKKGTESH